jgi:hypothetical protein
MKPWGKLQSETTTPHRFAIHIFKIFYPEMDKKLDLPLLSDFNTSPC